jgi:hypothetical protein
VVRTDAYPSLSHKRRGTWVAGQLVAIKVRAAELLTPRDQPMLMPVDMWDWLPDDDLVFVVACDHLTGPHFGRRSS